MSFYTPAVDLARVCSEKESVNRYPDGTFKLKFCLQVLWEKGVRFSEYNDKSRRVHPSVGLHKNAKLGDISSEFRFVVITKKTEPLGNKCWGRIDFLVKHCGFRFIDERK